MIIVSTADKMCMCDAILEAVWMLHAGRWLASSTCSEDEAMAATKDLLQGFIRALSEPTRGAILTELAHEGELTATQLARRLGLTANNVYHHMRVLRELGVVGAPRAAPRETYVEKYYQLAPEMQTLLSGERDPEWFDRAQGDL